MSPSATINPVQVGHYAPLSPYDRSLLAYRLHGPGLPTVLAVPQIWEAVVQDDKRYTLELCSLNKSNCFRVKVADLLLIRPTLAQETRRSDVLVCLGEDRSGFHNAGSVQPWLHPIQMDFCQQASCLSWIPAVDLAGIDLALSELRKITRSAEGYESENAREDVKRVFASCIPNTRGSSRYNDCIQEGEIDQLFLRWQQAQKGTCRIAETQFKQVVDRLLHSYDSCDLVLRNLVLFKPELLPQIRPDAIRAALMLMMVKENNDMNNLDPQSACVFTLQQAAKVAKAVQTIPGDSFDLATYRTTYHLDRLPPTLINDLPLFQRRLNTFLTGNSEIDPFQNADWTKMAISGSLMTWALSESSLRLGMTKQQELELYRTSDVDVPCSHAKMDEFLDHVNHTIAVIERNLGSTGAVQVRRQAKIFLISRDTVQYEKLCTAASHSRAMERYRSIVAQMRQTCRDSARHSVDLAFLDVPEDQIECSAEAADEDMLLDLTSCAYLSGNPPLPNYLPSKWLDCSDQTMCGEEDMHVSQSAKIRYTHPNLIHPLEFYCNTKHPIAHVAGYHLECVRAVYTGSQVYLTTSAVIAYCTGKTFSPWGDQTGRHADIVNKYARRGFRVNYCDDQLEADQLQDSADSDLVQYRLCGSQN